MTTQRRIPTIFAEGDTAAEMFVLLEGDAQFLDREWDSVA